MTLFALIAVGLKKSANSTENARESEFKEAAPRTNKNAAQPFRGAALMRMLRPDRDEARHWSGLRDSNPRFQQFLIENVICP